MGVADETQKGMHMIADRYVVNVEGLVLREGRYLLGLRGPGEDHAPGTLAPPGGKVEPAGSADDVLENTLRREIREEVGVEVHDEMVYLESKSFVADDGEPVVDVVFLCRYQSGTAAALDPAEVEAVRWMTAAEAQADPRVPPWTRHSLALAERVRRAHGW
jgi:8-oxo-dGTP pyrophosphatase MutT (NUDIX family)